MKQFIDILGWYGAVAVLLAYGLNSFEIIKPRKLFQFLNITGSFGLLINSAYYTAWPSVGVNVVWMLIGFFALGRLYGRLPGRLSGSQKTQNGN